MVLISAEPTERDARAAAALEQLARHWFHGGVA